MSRFDATSNRQEGSSVQLPSGLASISARLDDAPNARGAVAFGRMVRAEEERRKNAMFRAIVDGLPTPPSTSLAERVERCDRRDAMMAFLR